MLYFVNDYSEGAHPTLLQRLLATNMEHLAPYGEDIYSCSAREKIRAACGKPDADVFFLTGGTQTNMLVCDTMLQPWQGVISSDAGHIACHEAGAIEGSGHKVLTLPHTLGRLSAATVREYFAQFYADENHDHMVFPGMVYISHPTEYGTLYSKAELTALAKVCRKYGAALYMDGARLGYALACPESDLTLPDIAALCDAFYIGGTKIGALCGEALVFPKGNAPAHFMTMVKRRGAMSAKGRLIGVQFDALFTNGLYEEIGGNAIRCAAPIKQALREKGYTFFIDSPSNQIFVVLEDNRLEALRHDVQFSFWERYDENHTVIRIATSWATDMDDVQRLIALL